MGLSSAIGETGFSLSNITSAIQQYVVAPLQAFGLGGYLFQAQGESLAHLSADISDHYTEDNKAIQDQIAVHPKRITLKGYVGELVYTAPGQEQPYSAKLTQKLTRISAYLPSLSIAADQAQRALADPPSVTFSGLLNTTANIYGLVKNALGATGNMKNQQDAYKYFEALMQSKTLMAIQTPWEFITNMAIESIVAVQPENSIFITDFSVTFKEIRIAQTQTVAFTASGTGGAIAPGGPLYQGDSALQAQPVTVLGPTQGLPVSTPLVDTLRSSIFQ